MIVLALRHASKKIMASGLYIWRLKLYYNVHAQDNINHRCAMRSFHLAATISDGIFQGKRSIQVTCAYKSPRVTNDCAYTANSVVIMRRALIGAFEIVTLLSRSKSITKHSQDVKVFRKLCVISRRSPIGY